MRDQRKTDRENATPRKCPRAFMAAAVLASGLALLSACGAVQKPGLPSMPRKSAVALPKTEPVTAELKRIHIMTSSYCMGRRVEGRGLVSEGEMLVDMDSFPEKNGTFKVWVSKIDRKGIAVMFRHFVPEFNAGPIGSVGYWRRLGLPDESLDRRAVFRVNYGETKSLAPWSEKFITVKAERTDKPGTAMIEVTWD